LSFFVTRLEKLKWREFSEVESDKKKKLFITSIGLIAKRLGSSKYLFCITVFDLYEIYE